MQRGLPQSAQAAFEFRDPSLRMSKESLEKWSQGLGTIFPESKETLSLCSRVRLENVNIR